MKRVLCALIFCLVCVLAGDVNAQTWPSPWPSRPFKLIVPTGPGAATDVMARMLADGVSRKLDQPMVVENMPGASGIVAHHTVARAGPDGYTFLFTNTSGLAINLISFKQLPYDPTKDFTAVATVCNQGPQMISVNADLPVKTLSDLIAYAKANRGKLSIAFDTTAGAAAFGAKLFNRRADLGLVEVPFRSAAQMTQDVASGVNQVMISSVAAAQSVVDAGKVRRIAITSKTRFRGLPELPAVSETLPGIAVDGFFAIVAPAGTPADIVARLNREIAEYLKSPEIQQRLISFGLATEGAGTPAATAQFIRNEQDHWRALAQELDVEPQ